MADPFDDRIVWPILAEILRLDLDSFGRLAPDNAGAKPQVCDIDLRSVATETPVHRIARINARNRARSISRRWGIGLFALVGPRDEMRTNRTDAPILSDGSLLGWQGTRG